MPEYKVVLAIPTSADPPAGADILISTDEMVGVQKPLIPSFVMATPYDYGAIGDGVADDTQALSDWLDAIAGGAGFGKTGTYAISSTLLISSNTTIIGAGQGSFIITTTPDFPNTQQMLVNRNVVGSGPKTTFNIAISGTTFQGSSTLEIPGAEQVGMAGVQNVTIRDCTFQHWRRHLLTLANTDNVTVEGCTFYDWGALTAVPSPGSCLYDGGYAIWMGGLDTNVRILNNLLISGQWTGILLGDEATVTNNQIVIDGNIFKGMQEAFIFGGANSCAITNNKFIDLGQKDCSGQGLELGGCYELTISGNQFYNTFGASIYLFTCRVVNITNNIFDHPNTNGTPGGGSGLGAVMLNAHSSFGYGMDRVTITGNTFADSALKSDYGVYLQSNFAPMTNVTIQNNNFAPESQWITGVVGYDDSTVRGTGFMVRDNNAAPRSDISVVTVNFIIPASTTGSFTVPGVGFSPSRIEFQAVLNSTSTASGNSIGQQQLSYIYNVSTNTITAARSQLASSGMTWAANGTAGFSNDINRDCSICVREPDGTPIAVAHVTAVNSDGFTLTIINAVTLAVDAGGTGYAVNDTGTITLGDDLGTYRVLAESAGVVTSVMYTGGGLGIITDTGVATAFGGSQPGSGTGLTVDVTVAGDPTAEAVVVTAICYA